MPITTYSLPAVSHPEWDEIIDAKGSFGWQAVPVFKYDGPFLHRAYQYEGPYFVISANLKNLNESEVKIQPNAKLTCHRCECEKMQKG